MGRSRTIRDNSRGNPGFQSSGQLGSSWRSEIPTHEIVKVNALDGLCKEIFLFFAFCVPTHEAELAVEMIIGYGGWRSGNSRSDERTCVDLLTIQGR
jgi:hypothetical protein